MATYYVFSSDSKTVFVKEGEFFKSQGGFTDKWGNNWKPVEANTIGEARRIGAKMFGVELSFIYKHEV